MSTTIGKLFMLFNVPQYHRSAFNGDTLCLIGHSRVMHPFHAETNGEPRFISRDMEPDGRVAPSSETGQCASDSFEGLFSDSEMLVVICDSVIASNTHLEGDLPAGIEWVTPSESDSRVFFGRGAHGSRWLAICDQIPIHSWHPVTNGTWIQRIGYTIPATGQERAHMGQDSCF